MTPEKGLNTGTPRQWGGAPEMHPGGDSEVERHRGPEQRVGFIADYKEGHLGWLRHTVHPLTPRRSTFFL